MKNGNGSYDPNRSRADPTAEASRADVATLAGHLLAQESYLEKRYAFLKRWIRELENQSTIPKLQRFIHVPVVYGCAGSFQQAMTQIPRAMIVLFQLVRPRR